MAYLAFVHGLNSSHHSFKYISSELGGISKINYNSYQALAKSIAQVAKQLPEDEPLVLVGHSLGGIIATLIAEARTHLIEKLVTISSPLAGSRAAVYARWVMRGVPVLSDITPRSSFIQTIANMEAPCPTLSVISTGGNLPMSAEPNDSVVTVASQKALKFAKKVEVKASHFEVLQHDKTVETLRNFIDG